MVWGRRRHLALSQRDTFPVPVYLRGFRPPSWPVGRQQDDAWTRPSGLPQRMGLLCPHQTITGLAPAVPNAAIR